MPGPGTGGGGGSSPDAGGGGGSGVDASPAGGPDGGGNANCDDLVTAGLQSGEHNPGESCNKGGSHDGPAADGPAYTAAGTLFKAGGTNPDPGATIHLIDANGNDIPLVTAQNGNFYTSQTLAFPLQTRASACPFTLSMSTQVQSGQGSCNQAGGCHDANLRMSLP